MKKMILTAALLATTAVPVMAQERCDVAWSRYIGWEVAHLIQETGIADRWGEEMGVDLQFTYINDYIETLNQFSARSYDAVTATTIDTLTIPAVGGVDSTVLVIGDFSNGNDAVLVNDPTGSVQGIADLKGKDVHLVEYSISDYLLQRALEANGMSIDDINLINTSDADIGAVFASGGEGTVVVTWNPIVMTAMSTVDGARNLYNSASIPGEILDAVVVHTDTSDACKGAIAGAWYEGMAVMGGGDAAADEAIALMAENASGGTMGDQAVAWFQFQLGTTQMFYNPADAAAVANSADLQDDTQRVYDFALSRELLTAPVGIAFPDGTIIGDPENVTMRFDASYMERAAAGTLGSM